MPGPRITVIGAGSYFFGKQVIRNMATSPILAGGTLAFVDTNPAVLSTMVKLAERVFDHTKCACRIKGTTDFRQALPDSDFIVLSFSNRNAHFRGVDTRIAKKHGIRMCSSDTIGPGGIFRALREIPRAVEIARAAEKLCPNAWLINYINPTAVLGMAIRRFSPGIRSFALCDGLHEPHNTLFWCKHLGILPKDAESIPPRVRTELDLRVGGVNHCTWMTRFTYQGRDMFPALRTIVERQAREHAKHPAEKAKPRFNDAYALQLLDLYGAYPMATSHTKEYVPFFQGYGVAPVKPEPIRYFDAKNRAMEMAADWKRTSAFSNGKISEENFLAAFKPDHATDIIESMWGGLGKPFYVNYANQGAISNLPKDAFVELRSDVDMQGIRRHPFGEMPRGLLALQHQVLDTHEMTAEAAMTCDKSLLRRAMLTDPLCNNIGDADNCIRDLLHAERDALPKAWFE